MEDKIIVSFSGGQTSGFLSYMIKNKLTLASNDYDPVFIFANTGLENEETLQFVDRCDKEFDLGVTWVEAVTNPEHGKGVTHRVTNFNDAFRNHQYKHPDHPFHAHIRKNGVPNMNKPQCSDRLKEFAIEHYKKVNGLKGYPHAIGIRSDESSRATSSRVEKILLAYELIPQGVRIMNNKTRKDRVLSYLMSNGCDEEGLKVVGSYLKKLEKYNLVYPLCDWVLSGIDKTDVNDFWESQSFRLELDDHEGNCQTCWKKSHKKLHLIASEHPERFEAMKWFEEQYSFVKPNDNGDPRVFFRKNHSADDILEQSKMFKSENLRKMIYSGMTEDDLSGCAESCNGYATE